MLKDPFPDSSLLDVSIALAIISLVYAAAIVGGVLIAKWAWNLI